MSYRSAFQILNTVIPISQVDMLDDILTICAGLNKLRRTVQMRIINTKTYNTTILYYIILHIFSGVSGDVNTYIVKVLTAVCELDNFAKVRPFAVQTFDL